MKEKIEIVINVTGVITILCAIIRYLSFYFLYFRSKDDFHNDGKFKVYIGSTRFTSKVFSKIDFEVFPKFHFLKWMSNFSLHLTITGMMILIVATIIQALI